MNLSRYASARDGGYDVRQCREDVRAAWGADVEAELKALDVRDGGR